MAGAALGIDVEEEKHVYKYRELFLVYVCCFTDQVYF